MALYPGIVGSQVGKVYSFLSPCLKHRVLILQLIPWTYGFTHYYLMNRLVLVNWMSLFWFAHFLWLFWRTWNLVRKYGEIWRVLDLFWFSDCHKLLNDNWILFIVWVEIRAIPKMLAFFKLLAICELPEIFSFTRTVFLAIATSIFLCNIHIVNRIMTLIQRRFKCRI